MALFVMFCKCLRTSTRAHHASANREHILVPNEEAQDLEAALRHEHGLREDAERGERLAANNPGFGFLRGQGLGMFRLGKETLFFVG